MHFACTVFFIFILLSCSARAQQDLDLLFAALTGLFNGLQYMQDHIYEINLDGAFGCRLVAEILHGFAESRPDLFVGRQYVIKKELMMLSEKAYKIVNEARSYLETNDPEYWEAFGRLLEDSGVRVWHPGRLTNASLRVQPLPQNESVFDGEMSNGCLQETFCSSAGIEKNNCHLSTRCLQASSRLNQTDYVITHQILFLQSAQMRNCLSRCKIEVTDKLKDALCSNVMRDAENIANIGFPVSDEDLFMEQVGLCGLWGYKDFYKRDWLLNILQWQELSGCYKNSFEDFSSNDISEVKKRVKRTEKILKDGCRSHKTAVALMALAASIRFSIDEQY